MYVADILEIMLKALLVAQFLFLSRLIECDLVVFKHVICSFTTIWYNKYVYENISIKRAIARSFVLVFNNFNVLVKLYLYMVLS